MRLPAALALLAIVSLAPAAAAGSQVKVMGGFFDPDSLDLLVGDEVTWTNEDSMPHTVTSTWDEGATFDVVLKAGESFTYRFDVEGAHVVHCRPHAYPDDAGEMEGMVMSVQVFPLDAGAGIAAPLHKTPAPGLALLIAGLACASLLLRRTRA
jgi:plastocyanin